MGFFDLKVLIVLATAPWWMPFARLLWEAINPYPGLGTPKTRHGVGDHVLHVEPYRNEEWAQYRLRRRYEERGEEAPLDPRHLRARPRAMRRAEPPRLRRSA